MRAALGAAAVPVTADPGQHRCPCWDRAGPAQGHPACRGAVAVYEYIGWWVARGQEGTLGGGN